MFLVGFIVRVLFDPIPKRYGVHDGNSFRNSCLWNMILADFFYQEMNGHESIYATHWDCFICSSSPALPRFFTSRAWRGLPPKWQPKQWIKSRTLPCKGQGGWELGAMGGFGPWMRTMTTGTNVDIHGFSAYKKKGGLNRVAGSCFLRNMGSLIDPIFLGSPAWNPMYQSLR